MTWATRWQRFREVLQEFAEVFAIARAVEAKTLTAEQAAEAINRIGADRHEDAKQKDFDLVTD